MKHCTKCGEALKEEMRFCPGCGASVDEVPGSKQPRITKKHAVVFAGVVAVAGALIAVATLVGKELSKKPCERTFFTGEHTYVELGKSEATCTTDGKRQLGCTACGDRQSQVTPATGHSWKEASCKEPKMCTVCSEKEGLPLGHTIVDDVCTTCKLEFNKPSPVSVVGLKYYTDDDEHVHFSLRVRNNSDKEIKYINLRWGFYNTVGDKIEDADGADVKITGPLASKKTSDKESYRCSYRFTSFGSMKWEEITVEYMDGTTEIINEQYAGVEVDNSFYGSKDTTERPSPITIVGMKPSEERTGEVSWQYRIRNNSDKDIKAVYLEWGCYDAGGNKIQRKWANNVDDTFAAYLAAGATSAETRSGATFENRDATYASMKWEEITIEYADGAMESLNQHYTGLEEDDSFYGGTNTTERPSPITIVGMRQSEGMFEDVQWSFRIRNNSDKEIKSIEFEWSCYNAVGDKIRRRLAGGDGNIHLKFTGPLAAGKTTADEGGCGASFGSSTYASMRWEKVTVEYTDGTIETINEHCTGFEENNCNHPDAHIRHLNMMLKKYEELNNLLASITDKESADAAADKVALIFKEILEMGKELRKLGEPSNEAKEFIRKTLTPTTERGTELLSRHLEAILRKEFYGSAALKKVIMDFYESRKEKDK